MTPPPPSSACDRGDRSLARPLTVHWEDADLYAVRIACPTSGGALRAEAGILIATSDFYGSLRMGARLDGRYQWRDDVAFTMALDVIHFQLVQNATIARTRLALGQLTLGALLGRFERRGFSFVPAVRIMIPTSSRFSTARAMAIDPALVFQGSIRDWLDAFGSLGYAVWGAANRAGLEVWSGPTVSAGVAAALGERLTLVLQLDAKGRVGPDRTDGASPDFSIRRVALSTGLRLRLGKAFRIELAAGRVFAGTDRTDIAAGLTLSVHDR